MKKKLLKKLRSRAGETLGETLASLLIAALALVMLAGAISASFNIITRTRDKLDSYYGKAENMIHHSSASGTGIITIQDSSVIDPLAITYEVDYYTNAEFSDTPVVAYVIKSVS